jgi:Tol biopolymer transport system component
VKADWAGEPVVISDSIRQQGQGGAAFSVSQNGVVAYDPTPLWGQQLELAWVGRDGKSLSVFAGLDNGGHTVALSPDDKVAAVEQITTGANAVWLIDSERGTRTRLTFEKEAQGHAIWSPEGRRVAYFMGQPGATTRLLVKAVSGTRAADPVITDTELAATPKQPTDWSRDGRFILFEEQNAATGWDLKYVDTTADRRVAVAVQSPFLERLGQLSPDGRLIAYESNETGQLEVFVATFPDASSRWPISNRGGTKPRWNSNGRELLFVDGDGILQSVTITTSGGFRAGRPAPLFELGAFETDGYHYAISRDGTRILVMRTSANAPQPKLTVIMNWRSASE